MIYEVLLQRGPERGAIVKVRVGAGQVDKGACVRLSTFSVNRQDVIYYSSQFSE